MADTATAVSPCEIICRAAARIEKRGWVQYSLATSKGYCLKGACEAEVRDTPIPQPERDFLLEILTLHLAAALPGRKATGLYSWNEIMGYNDDKERTKEQVLEVMRKAGTCQ